MIDLPIEELKHDYTINKLSAMDLAFKYLCSEKTIIKRLKDNGVYIRSKRLGSPSLKGLDPAIINDLYWNKVMSTREIAEIYNVTPPTINAFMRANDIPLRSPKHKGRKTKRRKVRVIM